MRHIRPRRGVLLLVLLGGAVPAGAAFRDQVEADWLRQDVLRNLPAIGLPMTTQLDAAGAVDGFRDGQWGFHTALDPQPWWQVDLGQPTALDRVVVYNRCDGGAGSRAAHLELLISDDTNVWTTVYRHDGTTFGGQPDGRPLVVKMDARVARYVRLQLPEQGFLHLDEVEIYPTAEPERNIALGRPADQSSLSPWSKPPHVIGESDYRLDDVVRRGLLLADDLAPMGVDVTAARATLERIAREAAALPDEPAARKPLYFEARWTVRRLAFANPLLDFDRIVFAKRAPASFSHMSDQYYGWWSRPGGGLYVLEGFTGDEPRARRLTEGFAVGSFLRPDLSPDGRRLLFAYCVYHEGVARVANKVDKEALPEDAFYHLFELDLETGSCRQITTGRYDDFDGRYLPNGDIVFLSTRRGPALQYDVNRARLTLASTQPDCYVRCGGDHSRPVAVYTLHTMHPDGTGLRPISAFEMFEWTPSVANDGRILYARWDYIDRSNMPFMSLWSTHPDGTHPELVYGNFTRNPHCVFEARAIPGSAKLVATASGHHSITAGSLILIDPRRGNEEGEPLTRLTPEVCFPESEGWPESYYVSPYPLSERYFLVAWSDQRLGAQGALNPVNATGIYLYDAFGNLELLHRDPQISSVDPLPLRPRPTAPVLAEQSRWEGPQSGRFMLLDVYQGMSGVERGAVKRLRVIGVPAKTQPEMNSPNLGVIGDDPGKVVLGTVPVEPDGSAHFLAPSGVALLFQALDEDGCAIRTMRTATYLQPGQTLSCVGCHEPRYSAPPNSRPAAARRAPSRLSPGPEGSWPFRFDRLVQPVLDARCVHCHRPDAPTPAAPDLAGEAAWSALVSFGRPSLRDQVTEGYHRGTSPVGTGIARNSQLLALLQKDGGHHGVVLSPGELDRLITWLDCYGQRLGSFGPEQEAELERLRERWADLLTP